MTGFWKRAAALICAAALWLGCGRGLAEFSPRYAELLEEDGMTLAAGFSLDSASIFGRQSLDIVNGWLEGLQVRLNVGPNSRAEVILGGESIFTAAVNRENGYTLTTFFPSGDAYLTSPEGPDALMLLAGEDSVLPDITALPGIYAAAAPSLYAALENHTAPKTVKEPTSIKNASAAASYVNYAFKDGELNEAWEDILAKTLPKIREALLDQPQAYALAEETLAGLSFSGECRFKRFLDKEGNELGLQFTGQAEKDGDKRKVTLFGGYTPDKGGYVSLTLTGVGTKNTWKGSLGVKLTAKNGTHTLTAEGSLNRVQDGMTTAYTLNGNMKNVVGEEGERWSGKFTLTATENKVKTTWTLTPDLTYTDQGLAGDVAVQRKTGSKVTLKGTAHILLTETGSGLSPAATSAKDLRGLSTAAAKAAVQAELSPLAWAMARMVMELPENERTLLLHELRTDAWMDGPAVPVAAPGAAADGPEQERMPQRTDGWAESWVVEEDE